MSLCVCVSAAVERDILGKEASYLPTKPPCHSIIMPKPVLCLTLICALSHTLRVTLCRSRTV